MTDEVKKLGTGTILKDRENLIKVNKAFSKSGFSPLGILCIIVFLVLPFFPPFNKEYIIRWLTLFAVVGVQAIAFDFTAGYINVVNFGFAAFVGLGGYTSGLLANNFGLTPWIGMFAGAIASAILGFVTGLLSLRLRGIFALCLTWFVGLALMGLAVKMVSITRGSLGLRVPFLFKGGSNLPYFYTIIGIMIITYFVLKKLAQSHMGLAFRAIGQNMEAAKTSGINPTHYRIINFTISCAFAGLVGGFYAHYYGILTPDVMDTNHTLQVLVVAYIGGRQTLWGGAIAVFPFLFIMELLRSQFASLPGLNLIIYGLFLILIMIYYPGGAAQLYRSIIERSPKNFVKFISNRKIKK